MKRARYFGWLLAAILVASCAGDPEAPSAWGTGGEVVGGNGDVPKTIDLGADGSDGTDGTDGSDATDGGCDDGPPPACLPGDGAEAGFMCPCETNGDCDSGLCVPTPQGKVCSKLCVECCNDGFRCELLTGAGADAKYACVAEHLHLCRPCTSNAECENPLSAAGERCVSFGPEGSFCGSACGTGDDCPSGYVCDDVDDVMGQPSRQCVPADGEACECSVLAIEQGASTTCSVSNEIGTCKGTRACQASGLGACSASAAAAETCNGIDDDCDAQLDEDSCPPGEQCFCNGGACACGCPMGQTNCGGKCVDTDVSTAHCGGCDAPCGLDNVDTHLCDGGECKVVKCGAGWENLDGDPANGCECKIETEICDGLDNDCDGVVDDEPSLCSDFAGCTGQCLGGQCVCPTGCDKCFGTCVPPETYATDPSNCGFCGVKCTAENLPNVSAYTCEGGECGVGKCKSPWVDANGESFDGCECQKTASTETCDGVDNDCDGVIDNYTEACSSECGVGVRKCTAGEWSSCNAPQPKQCTDWVTCAKVPMCVESCPTAPAEICNGVDDNCNGTTDEGYTCVPGAGSVKACGNCGSQQLSCSATCEWQPVGECVPGGICAPGANDVASCGKCGTKSRSCSDQCGWTEFGACTGEGACMPGDTESEACGLCGTRTRTCTAGCTWGAWSACGGQGVCAPGANDSQSCGKCGSQARTCNDACAWGEWSSCGGQGVCSPGADSSVSCGACGTQARQCSAQCTWENVGQCAGQGACTPGTVDQRGCGNCGSQTRVCTDLCTWGDWTPCEGSGVCSPGSTDSAGCGNCGSKTRVCTDQCTWGTYGSCTGEGVCAPGAQDEQGCGNCGSKVRTCTAQCSWGSFGACGDQGECAPGNVDTQACGSCGSKSRTCSSSCSWGGWSACGAEGVCSPGEVQTEPCGNCGTRSRTCTAQCGWGAWSSCGDQGVCSPGTNDAAGCGNCGTKVRTCTSQCTWGNYGTCSSQGECTPGTADTAACGNCGTKTRICTNQCSWGAYGSCSDQGVCAPGSTDSASCGNCGTKTRTCTNQCTWGSYGSCGGQGVCSPGSSDSTSCGNCGTKSRTCTDQCSWGAYGTCQDQGACAPGSVDTASCGNCGSRTRSCSSQCTWGSYGTCTGQGVCSPGQVENQTCGNCGVSSRTCTSSCGWGGWGTCTGQGACSPGTTSSCTNACGTQTCGSGCAYGSCNFTKDQYEPNDTYAQAHYVGNFQEGQGIPPISNAWLHQVEPALATPGEIDRYYFYCTESGNIFDWSFRIKATLSGVGGWHSVCLFYDKGCNGSVDKQVCKTGTGALTADTGDLDANNGSDDDGCIDVEVFGDWSCSPYTLQFTCD